MPRRWRYSFRAHALRMVSCEPMAEKIKPFALKGYFERYGRPVVERNRLWGLVLLLSVGVAALAGAIGRMAPLKTVVPYVVQVNSKGVVQGIPVKLRSPPPTHAQLRYWLALWVRQLLAIEPVLSRRGLSQDYQMTRGDASVEFLNFLKRYRPVGRLTANPALRVVVGISSVNFLGGRNVYVKAVTRDEITGVQKDWALTLTYQLVPPRTVEEAYKNPLGLRMTNLSISEGN